LIVFTRAKRRVPGDRAKLHRFAKSACERKAKKQTCRSHTQAQERQGRNLTTFSQAG
jgi:hypothetical protein